MYASIRAPKLSARLEGASRILFRITDVLGEFGYLEFVFRLLRGLPLMPNQVSSFAPFTHPKIGLYSHKVDNGLHCPLVHGLVDKQSPLEVHRTGGNL